MSEYPVIGVWQLTLATVEPGNFATFEIRNTPTGRTDPEVRSDESSMVFAYKDGRRTVYFTANLLCAEYTPGKKPA